MGVNTGMDLTVSSMNRDYAIQILNWKYEIPYDFYNNELTQEALEELLNSSYYALVDSKNELFGFFCTGKSAQVPAGHVIGAYEENLVDLGLGMNPDKVGRGSGTDFCRFILNVIKERHGNGKIRLTVAEFNQRAIHLYEKLGFEKAEEFKNDRASFITMVQGEES